MEVTGKCSASFWMRPGTGSHDHIKIKVSRRAGYKVRKLVTHAKIPEKVPSKVSLITS